MYKVLRTLSPLGETVRRTVDLQPGEGRAVGWSFLYFFCLLSSYYILRPIRDEMGISAGIENMQWLFTGTFVAMLMVVPVFGWITSRFRRGRFLPLVYLFFIATILLFYALFDLDPEKTLVAPTFFIWLSVFNLFVVSVFWSFMNDLFHDAQAKRLFGFIAAGGTAGAIVGPLLTATLVQTLGMRPMLLLSAGLLAVTMLCIRRLITWQQMQADPGQKRPHASEDLESPLGGGVFDGITLAARSPYLAGICVLILLYATLSTFLYFQQAQIIRDAFADSESRTAVFAGIDLAVNTLTLLLQFFVTGRLVKKFGLGLVLALIPMLLSVGFLVLGLFPILPVLVAVQVLRRAGNYAIMRPAREMLYVVLKREEKYKAKNFIDTVVYRGGDAVSSWVYTAMRGLGLGLATIAWIAVPLSLLWAGLAWKLGKTQHMLAQAANRKNRSIPHD